MDPRGQFTLLLRLLTTHHAHIHIPNPLVRPLKCPLSDPILLCLPSFMALPTQLLRLGVSPSLRSCQWGWAMLGPEVSTSEAAASAPISQMEKLRHRVPCPRTPGSSRAVTWTLVGPSHRVDYLLPSLSPSLRCAQTPLWNPTPQRPEASPWRVPTTLLPA